MGRPSKKDRQRQKDIEDNLCCNPFRKRRCGRADIEVYVRVENTKLPICHKCWKEINTKDWNLLNGKLTVKVRKVYKERLTKGKRRKRSKK